MRMLPNIQNPELGFVDPCQQANLEISKFICGFFFSLQLEFECAFLFH